MTRNQRERLVIEPDIQYSLVRQLVQQWFTHLAASMLLLAMLQVLLGGFFRPWSEHLKQVGPTLSSLAIAMACLLPVYIRNSLKLSNRFVGPIHRFRKELREIAAGKDYQPLEFRGTDFWPTIANELDEAVEALNARATAAANRSEDAPATATPGGGVVFPSDGAVSSPGAPAP